MDNSTASTIGTILGAFAASFAAQMWGNLVTRKTAQKVVDGTAAQSTSNTILSKVENVERRVEVLVNQPSVVQNHDDRSPRRD